VRDVCPLDQFWVVVTPATSLGNPWECNWYLGEPEGVELFSLRTHSRHRRMPVTHEYVLTSATGMLGYVPGLHGESPDVRKNVAVHRQNVRSLIPHILDSGTRYVPRVPLRRLLHPQGLCPGHHHEATAKHKTLRAHLYEVAEAFIQPCND
jgi:hypothetical protein